MDSLDFLLGKEDIASIDLDTNGILNHLIISFVWEIDCGCFSCNKESKLTIYFPYSIKNKIISDLQDGKGKIFKYIKNHKDYAGELLDFRIESYEEEELV